MKNYRRLTEIFIFFSFFASFNVVLAQTKSSDSVFTLPIGTNIQVRMDNEINSKISSINDTFTATVSKPVTIREVEVLPIGAIIEGKILNVYPASAGKKDGRFEVKFETLRLANGTKLPIDGSLVNQNFLEDKSSSFTAISIFGGSLIGAVIGAIAGKGKGALIGAGAGAGAGGAISTQLKKGREAQIKANEEFVIKLNQSVTLPVEDY